MSRNNIFVNIDKVIANRIKLERINRGLTRRDVSSKIGVTIQQLSKYENNINRICPSRLFILAKLFNLSIYDFFYGGGINYSNNFKNTIRKITEIVINTHVKIDDQENCNL